MTFRIGASIPAKTRAYHRSSAPATSTISRCKSKSDRLYGTVNVHDLLLLNKLTQY